MSTGLPVAFTSAITERHLALNSPAAIVRISPPRYDHGHFTIVMNEVAKKPQIEPSRDFLTSQRSFSFSNGFGLNGG
jgi:hypothetical protein